MSACYICGSPLCLCEPEPWHIVRDTVLPLSAIAIVLSLVLLALAGQMSGKKSKYDVELVPQAKTCPKR